MKRVRLGNTVKQSRQNNLKDSLELFLTKDQFLQNLKSTQRKNKEWSLQFVLT